MANPTLPAISDATATALSDVVDPKTGVRHWKLGATKTDSPPLFTRYQQLHEHLFELLSRFGGGCVALGGLNVGVYALEYKIGATDKSFAGTASQALSASVTSYLYLDTDETLKISTSAWPGTDHFRIAKVTTNGAGVTALIDARMQNYQIGIVNAWYTVAAAGGVDLNGNALKNVGEFWPAASTELTLASDAITPTKILHSVDTQADAAADDLVTITADAAKVGRLLILRCENAARVVTIKSTGNIKLKDGNLVLDDVEKFVVLMQHSTTAWVALDKNFQSFGPLLQDLDANGKQILKVGRWSLQFGADLELESDAITVTHSGHYLNGQDLVADNLKAVNGGTNGQLLLLSPNSGQVITVYDQSASGGVNILLNAAGSTLVLNGNDWVLLYYDGSLWSELTRSRTTLSSLVGTGQVVPYAIGPCHYPGTPTTNQETWQFPVLQPFKLKRAKGRVKTAPAGGPCVVHVTKNGASIFAADANAINIAVSTLEDTSDTVDVAFAIGDYLSVKVTTVNAAADLTVSLDAFIEAITAA